PLVQQSYWVIGPLVQQSYWDIGPLVHQSYWVIGPLVQQSYWVIEPLVQQSYWVIGPLVQQSYWVIGPLVQQSYWVIGPLVQQSYWVIGPLVQQSYWWETVPYVEAIGEDRRGSGLGPHGLPEGSCVLLCLLTFFWVPRPSPSPPAGQLTAVVVAIPSRYEPQDPPSLTGAVLDADRQHQGVTLRYLVSSPESLRWYGSGNSQVTLRYLVSSPESLRWYGSGNSQVTLRYLVSSPESLRWYGSGNSQVTLRYLVSSPESLRWYGSGGEGANRRRHGGVNPTPRRGNRKQLAPPPGSRDLHRRQGLLAAAGPGDGSPCRGGPGLSLPPRSREGPPPRDAEP
ncbi:unnamed protein product, partial [Arctogadus glacialis]